MLCFRVLGLVFRVLVGFVAGVVGVWFSCFGFECLLCVAWG